MSEDKSLQTFIEDVHADFEQTQRDLKEIDILIKQSSAEVEKLAQRNAQSTAYVQQLETNFETLPRQDIRDAFEDLNDVQQRLYTMRGQLEKLQSDQRNLERLSETQQQILQYAGGGNILSLGSSSSSSKTISGDQSGIIRVIQTEESVRQGIVHKMHDHVASAISNFILQAEICQRFFDQDPDRARAELNALKNSAGTTFSNVKDFIFDLRPMMLDDLGVVPTLRRYTESFQEKNGVPVPITVTGVERRLESHIEVTIFRNVQELLQNALNHAQATQIQVSLDIAQDRIISVVEDNGRGFNADEALNNSRTIGLSTIRDRTQMLGGELDIQSSLGQGARVEFTIPISMSEVIA